MPMIEEFASGFVRNKAQDVNEYARCILLEVLRLGNPSGHITVTQQRDFFFGC